jgi:hypothetical protein
MCCLDKHHTKGVFDLTPKEYSLTNSLCTITGLTTKFGEARNAQTYYDMKGRQARLQREAQTGRKVLSILNFLPENRHLCQITTTTAWKMSFTIVEIKK